MKSTVEGRVTLPEVPLDPAKRSNSTCKKHFWPRAAICQIAFNGRECFVLWLPFLTLVALVEVQLLCANVCWRLSPCNLELYIMSCPTSRLIINCQLLLNKLWGAVKIICMLILRQSLKYGTVLYCGEPRKNIYLILKEMLSKTNESSSIKLSNVGDKYHRFSMKLNPWLLNMFPPPVTQQTSTVCAVSKLGKWCHPYICFMEKSLLVNWSLINWFSLN